MPEQESKLNFFETPLNEQTSWLRKISGVIALIIGIVTISIPFSIGLLVLSIDWKKFNTAYTQGSEELSSYLETVLQNPLSADPTATLVLSLFSVAFLIIPLYLVLRFIHRRSFLSVLTNRSKFDWKKMIVALSIYTSLLLLLTIITYTITWALGIPLPLRIVTHNWGWWLVTVCLLIPVVLVQVIAEEAIFRGYIFQYSYTTFAWLRSLVPNFKISKFVLVLLATATSTLLFGFAHASNGPFLAGFYAALSYFLVAVGLQYIVYKDNGLELAIGVHLANNLIALFLLGSTLDGGSLALIIDISTSQDINTPVSVVTGVLPLLVFYWIIFKTQWSKKAF